MSTNASHEIPRPPGRRSLFLYSPTPPPAPDGANATLRPSALTLAGNGAGGLASLHPTFRHANNSGATAMASGSIFEMRTSPVPQLPLAAANGTFNASAVSRADGGLSAVAAAAVATTSPRQLRGRLNEGTLHRLPLESPTEAAVLPAPFTHYPPPPPPPQPQQDRTTKPESSKRPPQFPAGLPSAAAAAAVSSSSASSRSVHEGSAAKSGARQHNGSSTLCPPGALPNSSRHSSSISTKCGSHTTTPPSAADATAVMRMVRDASLRNTWAVDFASAPSLRRAVTTARDACDHFEKALIEEVNKLRRDPAAYATILEREATVGAPYVRGDDSYFVDEAAAEEAATQLRRQVEGEDVMGGGPLDTVPSTPSIFGNSRAANGSLHTRDGLLASSGGVSGCDRAKSKKPLPHAAPHASHNNRNNKGNHPPQSPAPKKRSGPPTPPVPNGVFAADVDALLGEANGGGGGVVSADSPPIKDVPFATVPVAAPEGPPELTLDKLRQQFRCQQRYRGVLERAVQDMKAQQRQAQATQHATWAAEDEKPQKRRHRSANPSLAASLSSMPRAIHNHSGSPGVVSGSPNVSASSSAAAPAAASVGDGLLQQRRSEAAAQLHHAHGARIQTLEEEWLRARDACRRSLAGVNLILDAVRALRNAKPAPVLRLSRGLSLAARDTAVGYYGAESRVRALAELTGLTQRTVAGLQATEKARGTSTAKPAPSSGAATQAIESAPRTLEELCAREEGSTLLGNVAKKTATLATTNGTNAGGAVAPPLSELLPVLSDEALALAVEAQRACATYGYISDEVRGVHLQSLGSPRALLLQLLIGAATPVFDVAKRSPATAAVSPHLGSLRNTSSAASLALGDRFAGTESASFAVAENAMSHPHFTGVAAGAGAASVCCFAGVRLEGWVYAATPPHPTTTMDEHDTSTCTVTPEDIGLRITDDLEETFGVSSNITGAARAAMHTAHVQDVAAASAAQRLWPLLWSGAHLVGCGWQQVRGGRPVPTYTEAYAEQIAHDGDTTRFLSENKAAATGDTTVSGVAMESNAANATSAVCTTLLFASGFEEYEVVRGCHHMSPAATKRAIVDVTHPGRFGVTGGINDASPYLDGASDAVQQTWVEVHSDVNLSVLTPTVHPVFVPACATGARSGQGRTCVSAVVCVAVRELCGMKKASAAHLADSHHAGEAGALPGMPKTSSIRVVAQVVRQAEPTPLSPSVDAAEVLVQRSPVDPSVWLILVDTAAASVRCAGAEERPTAGGSQIMTLQEEESGLVLHVYARDVRDPTSAFVHLTGIRMQPQQPGQGGTHPPDGLSSTSPVLIAEEWRYLLDGLAGFPAASPASSTMLSLTPARTMTQGPSREGSMDTIKASGWATLHEPLIGRGGVLLYPISSNFCTPINAKVDPRTEGTTEALAATAPVRTFLDSVNSDAAIVPGALNWRTHTVVNDSTTTRTMHVALQLPFNANATWLQQRLATLHRLREQLTREWSMEERLEMGEEEAAGSGRCWKTRGSAARPLCQMNVLTEGDGATATSSLTAASSTSVLPLDASERRHTLSQVVVESVTNSTAATSHATSHASASEHVVKDKRDEHAASPLLSPTPALPPDTPPSAPPSVQLQAKHYQKSKDDGTAAQRSKRGGATEAAPASELSQPVISPPRKSGDGRGSRSTKSPSRNASNIAGVSAGTTTSASTQNVPSVSRSPSTPHRTVSLYNTPAPPPSLALSDFEVLLRQSTPPSGLVPTDKHFFLLPSVAHTSSPIDHASLSFSLSREASTGDAAAIVGVHPSLQPARLSLTALRTLVTRLQADAQVWQTYLKEVTPFLASERARLSGESAKKKGREQQRLQHDQEDVERELADVEGYGRRVADAALVVWEALRKRERAQVLRRDRMARVEAELRRLEGQQPDEQRSETDAAASRTAFAAPRVTLRLLNASAVAAGSGQRAAATVAAHAAARWSNAKEETNDMMSSVSNNKASTGGLTGLVVELQPLPRHQPHAEAASGAVCYTAACTVPPSFAGQAMLFIDDEVAVTWTL